MVVSRSRDIYRVFYIQIVALAIESAQNMNIVGFLTKLQSISYVWVYVKLQNP